MDSTANGNMRVKFRARLYDAGNLWRVPHQSMLAGLHEAPVALPNRPVAYSLEHVRHD